MKITKLLKIAQLSKQKDISLDSVLSFIDNLSEGFTLEQANDLALKNKNWEPMSKKHSDSKELSEEETQELKQQMVAALQESIHAECQQLPEVGLYQESVLVERDGEEVEELIYKREEYIKDLTQTLRYLADNFSENFTFQDEDIHPTLECEYPNTPDTRIPTYKVEAQTFCVKDVGLEKDFSHYDEKNQTQVFNQLYTYTVEQPALFFKDMSYLQLFALWGLDDLIEKSIVYGADIHYREKIHNKTALELYNPSSLNAPELTNYIKSLLDGSYDNGHYQILYEKKKLDRTISKQETEKKFPHFKL